MMKTISNRESIIYWFFLFTFFSEKYDITKHPNYKYLSDYDKRNTFDIEKFLSTKLKLKADDVFESYDMGTLETQQ